MPTNVQLSMAKSRPATTTNSAMPNGYSVAPITAQPRLVGKKVATMGSARGGIAKFQVTRTEPDWQAIANFQVARSASTSFVVPQASLSTPATSSSIGPLSTRSFSRSFAPFMSPSAVRACDYEPDSSDELDMEFAQHLKDLRPELGSALHLSKTARGSYEIEGRRVILLRELDDDDEEGDIVVQEEGTTDPEAYTPLEDYLQQSAHVAAFMTGNSEDSQHRKDLTFGDARIPNDTDPFTARLMCMQLACEQAEHRQNRVDEASTIATSANGNDPMKDPSKDSEKPRSWWESWESFFRPARREDRDDDATSEEGCY